jgi:hypothetical protein
VLGVRDADGRLVGSVTLAAILRCARGRDQASRP